MLKVGTQNQAKTLKVSAWPDGAKTLKVPGRSETVPRPYDNHFDRPYSKTLALRELAQKGSPELLPPDRAGEGHLLSEKGVTAILLGPQGT